MTKASCRIAHSQLLSGSCPWCKAWIGLPADWRRLKRNWDSAAITTALRDPDFQVRWMTLLNLSCPDGPVDIPVPLLSEALADTFSEISATAELALDRIGSDIGPEEIQRIEKEISSSEHGLALRIVALGFYFVRVLIQRSESEIERAARNRHILFMIEHAPESRTAGSAKTCVFKFNEPEIYSKAKHLWLEHVRLYPNNPQILGNAASFFAFEDKQLSNDLFVRAHELDPHNPQWAGRLDSNG